MEPSSQPASQATTDSFITIVIEPGGAAYFVSDRTPKGLGGGFRLSVPVLWGFEVAAGYTFVDVKSATVPFLTHHAYGAIAYRLDDFEHLAPWAEIGAGFFDFDILVKGRAPILDIALHVGAGVDFGWRWYFVGAFLRYEIYVLSGLTNFPAAITAGLRLGIRIPF
jgi:hypothetical protein